MAETQKTVSFSLGEHDRSFIQGQVEHGRFGNKTEVVRAGLRLLEDYENQQQLQRLRADIAKGDADIQAGRMTEYDSADALLKDLMED